MLGGCSKGVSDVEESMCIGVFIIRVIRLMALGKDSLLLALLGAATAIRSFLGMSFVVGLLSFFVIIIVLLLEV